MIGMLQLVRLVDRKKSPQQIPIAGNDRRVLARNYFTLILTNHHGQEFLFSRVRGHFACVKEWNETYAAYVARRAIKLEDLKHYGVLVVYYYRRQEFQFHHAWATLIFYRLRVQRALDATNRLTQAIYNRRSLALVERTQLMKYIATRYMEDSTFRPNEFLRLADSYGARIVRHPHFSSIARRERALLESLVQTGELARVNGGLVVLPALFATLDHLEIEDRRHRQGITAQRIVIIIGLATLVAAAVQAWAAYVSLHK
jgi:hypothetical protein